MLSPTPEPSQEWLTAVLGWTSVNALSLAQPRLWPKNVQFASVNGPVVCAHTNYLRIRSVSFQEWEEGVNATVLKDIKMHIHDF